MNRPNVSRLQAFQSPLSRSLQLATVSARSCKISAMLLLLITPAGVEI